MAENCAIGRLHAQDLLTFMTENSRSDLLSAVVKSIVERSLFRGLRMFVVMMLVALCVMTATREQKEAAKRAFKPYERGILIVAAVLWVALLWPLHWL